MFAEHGNTLQYWFFCVFEPRLELILWCGTSRLWSASSSHQYAPMVSTCFDFDIQSVISNDRLQHARFGTGVLSQNALRVQPARMEAKRVENDGVLLTSIYYIYYCTCLFAVFINCACILYIAQTCIDWFVEEATDWFAFLELNTRLYSDPQCVLNFLVYPVN